MKLIQSPILNMNYFQAEALHDGTWKRISIEGRQKRFTFEGDSFYVDLVFYNRLLKCYVLFD